MGFQAGHHFRWIERLDDIIVSTESQSLDLIIVAPPSGDEKDGDVADVPQFAAQQEAIRVRQADVQQDCFDGSAIKAFPVMATDTSKPLASRKSRSMAAIILSSSIIKTCAITIPPRCAPGQAISPSAISGSRNLKWSVHRSSGCRRCTGPRPAYGRRALPKRRDIRQQHW